MTIKSLLITGMTLTALVSCSPSRVSNYVEGVFGNKTLEFKGNPVERTLAVNGPISGIETHQSIVVNYTQGTAVNVSYTLPEDALEYIDIAVHGDALVCKMKSGFSFRRSSGATPITVYVTAPAVNDFKASSSGSIVVKNLDLASADVDLDASSSASIAVATLACRNLDVDVSSSGSVSVGLAKSSEIEVSASSSGTAQVNGICREATYKASSSGSASGELTASAVVEAKASSSGMVSLTGQTAGVEFSTSSSGHVAASDLKATSGTMHASSSGRIDCNVASPTSVSTSSAGTVNNRRQ